MGCAHLEAPPNAYARHQGDIAVVRCNSTARSWHLVCRDTTWMGEIGNCSEGILQGCLSALHPCSCGGWWGSVHNEEDNSNNDGIVTCTGRSAFSRAALKLIPINELHSFKCTQLGAQRREQMRQQFVFYSSEKKPWWKDFNVWQGLDRRN